MNNGFIVVGKGIGGQDNIINALNDYGIPTIKVNYHWPRDHYSYFMNTYVQSEYAHTSQTKPFGEGGFLHAGEDYILISDGVHISNSINYDSNNNPDYENLKQLIVAEGKKYFPNARIHVLPSGKFHNRDTIFHLDLYTILFPEEKVLFVDTSVVDCKTEIKIYERIAEEESLELVCINGDKDPSVYPLNALSVRRSPTRNFAVVDQASIKFIARLEKRGIATVPVKMPQRKQRKTPGKIHCQTNLFVPNNNQRLEDLFCKSN